MFLANFRVAISWALKQPLYYAVKVLGLALGIMSVALLVAYVDFVGKYDAHIADREQIYRVVGEDVSRVSGERMRYDFGSNAWIEPSVISFTGPKRSFGLLTCLRARTNSIPVRGARPRPKSAATMRSGKSGCAVAAPKLSTLSSDRSLVRSAAVVTPAACASRA